MPRVLAPVQKAIERPVVHFAIPVVFFAFVIVGAVRAYTPVPTYDMWEGALLPTFNILGGDLSELFRFWNEHRIVFSKILFWIDTRFFGARLVFLMVTNIALLVGNWLALCAAARHLIEDRALWRMVCAGLSALSFSWFHRENIDSPFQGQFLLAYLIPLLAFLCLAISAREPKRWPWFAASVVFGAASLGTMANGLLVFPLLLAMQAVLDVSAGRVSWFRHGLLAIVGFILTALWFQGFSSATVNPPGLVNLIVFAATFLGFVFADLAGVPGGIMGSLVFLGALFFVLRRASRGLKTLDPMFAAVLTFIGYVGATCLMTAYGRSSEVANAALVGRYATPSLLAWAALAILLAAILQYRGDARRLFAAAAVIAALLLLPVQLLRTTGDGGPNFAHGTLRAALALELGVADLNALAGVFPAPTRENAALLASIADRLAARGLSTFADPKWDERIAKIGKPPGVTHACKTAIDRVDVIPGENRYKAVSGWAIQEERLRQPAFIYLAADEKIVGLAVGRGVRPDVADIMGRKGRYAGFSGYLLASAVGKITVLCSGGIP